MEDLMSSFYLLRLDVCEMLLSANKLSLSKKKQALRLVFEKCYRLLFEMVMCRWANVTQLNYVDTQVKNQNVDIEENGKLSVLMG